MPRMGFEYTTTVFERSKTVHALDGESTVISRSVNYIVIIPGTCEILDVQMHHPMFCMID
jgi:hypothetical protein